MNKLLKKVLSFILILSILIIEYPLVDNVNAKVVTSNIYSDSTTWYENGGMETFSESEYGKVKATGLLPKLPSSGYDYPLTITRPNGSKYTLNYRLYKQKNLFVYGTYSNVNGNYFKCGYQTHTNLTVIQPDISYEGGYFKKTSGVKCMGEEQNPITHKTCASRGEWKYLGFDVNGNPFSNMWMINVATVTSFSARNWRPEPWKAPANAETGITSISTYNKSAYGDMDTPPKVTEGLQKWIAKTVNTMAGFDGIPSVGSPNGLSQDVYKFMYIQSPPTTKMAGSGRMWHKLKSNGELWYQTFSVPVLKEKKYLPIQCKIIDTSTPTDIPETDEADSNPATLTFTVEATLNDDVFDPADGVKPANWKPYWNDAASKTVKYTRSDLYNWTFNLTASSLGTVAPQTITHTSEDKNKATAKFTINTTVGKIRALPKATSGVNKGKREIFISANATPKYTDNTTNGTAPASDTYPVNTTKKKQPDPEPEPTVVIDIPTLNIENHIGEIAFDGVPFDDATDSTDKSAVASEELYIDGEPINSNEFFSGQYTFPATTDMNGYFAEVICKYNLDESKINITGLSDEEKDVIMSGIPLQYVSTDWVYVYPTKPNAHFQLTSNTWKQNRIINATENSASSNIQLVINKFPITEYRWSYGGDTIKLHKGTDTDLQKQLQYSTPGTYSLTLECKNSLGKWSDPYTVEYQVFEDYAPNIEVNLSDSVLTRTDELSSWHYDVNSTDGDKVSIAKIELWYDSNNDKTTEKKISEWNGLGDNGICELDDFPKYTPTELGYYKYKIFAKDEFVGVSGQDSLTQFITAADKKENTYEVEFWVDNYQPLADVYIDTVIERPSVDLFIMGDQALPQEKLTYLSDNRVNMENTLLGKNILPSINLWNMKTYEYSTPASTSSNTGTSYPSGSVPYSSAGYSGTLPRTSVSDNGGNHDFGYTASKTESKPASDSRSQSGSFCSKCNGGVAPSYGSSISYSSDGYSGTLSQSSYNYSGTSGGYHSACKTNSWNTFTRSWSYSGTVYKTTSYWVPDMRWISNYTGYYSGTIYKYVRQPYTNPWRAVSSKYIIYISDGTISELADFTSTVAKADAKIILAGTSSIQSQSPSCAKYIDVSGKTTQEIVNEALEFISQETPSIEQVYVLPNQTFTLNYGEDDLENDTIISREMQYVHNKDYFDNPTGQEPSTQTVFSDTTGWNKLDRNSFGNVGKYQIYRRVKDKPTGSYGDDYSYYSGATEVDIYVHRKPIALASLDWDFDAGTNTYKTRWIDSSYDLDHNISRANTDKGIVERKLMWQRNDEEWHYTIPDNLSPGTYKLRYYVKDIENTWSDVFTINIDGELHSNVTQVEFTLATSPPMQFQSKLRSKKLDFRTPENPVTLPASENLELYEVWTRYPSNPILTMALFKENGIQISPTNTVNFTNDTGKKLINDINWYDISYNISDKLADGNYIFKITANSQQSKTISFPVTLTTPINLKGYINGKTNNAQINTGDINIFTFTTSSYVNSTQLSFEGSTYYSDYNQIKLISDDGIHKTWTYTLDLAEGAYPDGKLGIAEFKATLPSDRSEIIYVNYKMVGIKASNFLITMMLDIGWRAYYFDVNNGIDDNHDGIKDRYPRHSNTDIGTLKLPINYFSLVGYNRNYIKAGYKVKGRIDIQGEPDSAYFKINYDIGGIKHVDNIFLTKNTGNTYLFEWIIPIDTDSKTYVIFDLVTKKGDSTYGNEKWVDKWDSRNLNQKVFYVKGDALEDLTFVQSH